MNLKKLNPFKILFVTLVCFTLNSCGEQKTSDNLNEDINTENYTIDCEQVKNECLENAKEIIPSFIEKIAIIESESNTEEEKNEKIKAIFQSLILADEIHEKEKYLKENCKEIHVDEEN